MIKYFWDKMANDIQERAMYEHSYIKTRYIAYVATSVIEQNTMILMSRTLKYDITK